MPNTKWTQCYFLKFFIPYYFVRAKLKKTPYGSFPYILSYLQQTTAKDKRSRSKKRNGSRTGRHWAEARRKPSVANTKPHNSMFIIWGSQQINLNISTPPVLLSYNARSLSQGILLHACSLPAGLNPTVLTFPMPYSLYCNLDFRFTAPCMTF